MTGEADNLSDFTARIEPFINHWRSLKFACMAVRVEAEWVQFVGKATLSTEPAESSPIIKRVVDLGDFRAYSGKLEAKVIHDLIANLRNSKVIAGMPEDPVRLVPHETRPYFWNQPYVSGRRGISNQGEEWPNVLETYGTGDSGVTFKQTDFWRDIDTRLRRHNPPYNGFSALCKRLGLQFERTGSPPNFHLYAELPARFVTVDMRHKEKKLLLTMEYIGSPELIIEWLPGGETRHEPTPTVNLDHPARREVAIPIPPGTTQVRANLLTMGLDADAISYRTDWENTLLRICEFFDSGQSMLSRLLFDEGNLKNVNSFELGVARLLALAGYTTLWFGKGAKGALPDLVAYARQPLGAERIIYGECTLKNPAEKVSDLAKRADDFRKHLVLESGTILPVIFVRNATTAQDRHAAIGLGLVLCDGGDIKRLQDKITSDASPDEIFQFLQSLASLTLIPGGVSGLFV